MTTRGKIGFGCLVLSLLVGVAAYLGNTLVWEFLFGAAYCLDGYGGCPWD